MDVFNLRDGLIDAYSEYATSFMRLRDSRVRERVTEALDGGRLWPFPQIGLNPAFHPGGTVDDLVGGGLLHGEASAIFRAGKSPEDGRGRPMTLHQHQVDAVRAARDNRNYVLTTGTGSGKSLSYIVPIVDHVLRTGSGQGIKALVVYPMNALANSQRDELDKFLEYGPWGGGHSHVTYERYTGQEDDEARQRILQHPPDIILTNYVMLELILTRHRDRRLVQSLGNLRFLVLDELHTYRGRQGADVALLVRRLREAAGAERLQCVGTSATLSSQGGHSQRQDEVSRVASLLFGAEVRPREVITETLERATPDHDLDDPAFLARLRDRLAGGAAPPADFAAFVADPLSTWIEGTFGLRVEEDRLVRATPLPLDGPKGGAKLLAEATGLDDHACREALRRQLLAGYEVVNPTTGLPVFAFRLHQFVSRGDTAYASPESPPQRYITLDRQRFVPGDRGRSLLPLAFCRACGQDYYVVGRRSTGDGSVLEPRDLGDTGEEPGRTVGFLYVSDTAPWPDVHAEELDRVPAEWLDDSGRLRGNHRAHLPRRHVVGADGTLDPAGGGSAPGGPTTTRGWWVPAPFRFCLACGVSYAGRLGRDYTRLTTLGSEGRSTATTIMSLAAVRYLRARRDLATPAKKLLSFTDNRQDASLQAGHFNDFVQVTLLRAALWRAVDAAGEEGLAYDEVPQRVFQALALPFDDYARDPELKGAARTDTNRVLREVLSYRLYRDLERGWRLTQPNLEQVGLLRIGYESLDELAADEEEWAGCHPALAAADPERRRFVLTVLLDAIRRELAIKVESLDTHYQEGLARRVQQRLDGPWAPPEEERLEAASIALPRGRAKGDNGTGRWAYVSARGGYGQFLRRPHALGEDGWLRLDETTDIIGQLFTRLKRYGLVEEVGADKDGTPHYQLPASAMRWRVGDGSEPYQDHIRMPNAPEAGIEANRFFLALYRSVGDDLVGVEAREHTAQVHYQDRVEREERFRSADLPVLYCSPTMELGVDISQLNVVNMRNVPPTPANYAQRSGRAGRSGQPALVFTYCAAGSSHDQHFFREPEKMVAGQVEPPRLDLMNEDLVRAHVHAVWLAESDLDLASSMAHILDLADGVEEPRLFPAADAQLHDGAARDRARQRAARVLADLDDRLRRAPWWSDDWLADTLARVPDRFEEAMGRWRSLYKAALQQAREQQRIKLSASRSAGDRRQADRLRREAENQLELLRAESDNRNQSDFYTYRYFAAEGFLPGYSFPRLPLSAFIPGRRRRGRGDDPEFLQRPRFLAISEFGPQSLIYHEGARYRINRVILPVGDVEADDGTLVTSQAKRCTSCGYLHPIPEPPGPDTCERCGALLPAAWENLFRLANVSTVRRDRITSDEEERQRKGYEVISGVRFARRKGSLSVDEATLTAGPGAGGGAGTAGGEPLFDLAYGDTTTIWRVNLGWRRRKVAQQVGFVLDLERGYWGTANDAEAEDSEDPLSKRTRRVIPYVEDSRNALLLRPARPLGDQAMASLQAALKVALQVVFQLEENELAAEPLPSAGDRNLLLFYESAEGGAGVLRRLVEDAHEGAGLWHRIATEALRRCHVDPQALEDVTRDGVEPCEAACYDCLLSYRNQTDHQVLDRALAIPVLARLRDAALDVVASGPGGPATPGTSPSAPAAGGTTPRPAPGATTPPPSAARHSRGSDRVGTSDTAGDGAGEPAAWAGAGNGGPADAGAGFAGTGPAGTGATGTSGGSPAAEEFMAFLEAGGYRQPDRSQVAFPSVGARPDFVYVDACLAVYVDGPVEAGERRDVDVEEALRDLGYRVLRFGHRDDWPQLVDAYASVFGEGNL